jgi:putative colanic acid biosysnthesis UDP-glucose lipid carrier transferase
MTEPVVFKRSIAIAMLTMLRAIAPAIVAIGTLYGLAKFYLLAFESHFMMLAVLVAILAPLILRLPPVTSMQLMSRQGPTAAGLMLRWAFLLVTLLFIGYLTKFSEEFSRRVIITWALVTPVPLILLSLGLNEVMRRVMFAPSNARSAVIAGYNDVSFALAERLRKNPELCVTVDGFFDDRSAERLGLDGEQTLLGGLSELGPYVKEHGVEVIFVALPMRHVQRVLDLLEDLRDTTASIYYVPDVFVFDLIQSRTGEILGMPVVAMCETPFFGYRGVVKRMMDLMIASLAVLVLLPLLLLVALLVKFTSPGPVIFKQRRYGLDGQEIHVYKFRTMTVTEDGGQIRQATVNDARVTPLGRVLRRYSIDELPQLFNVLEGTMSLVGPRPHAIAHNEEYRKVIKGYMVRHKVLPGMTGLAQVSGCRGETRTVEDMQARIEYDLDYLRRWSPRLDLKIIVKTALMLLSDRKAY